MLVPVEDEWTTSFAVEFRCFLFQMGQVEPATADFAERFTGGIRHRLFQLLMGHGERSFHLWVRPGSAHRSADNQRPKSRQKWAQQMACKNPQRCEHEVKCDRSERW